MSTNNNTSRPPPASTNTKSDPSAQYPVSNEHLTGLDATTTDKSDYGLSNASGTSEERRGEDLKLPEKSGQGFTKEKTASEGLVEGIERRM